MIVALWLFVPLREGVGRNSQRLSLADLLVGVWAGWATALCLVVWLLPKPGFDQIFLLPLVGAISGAGLVLWSNERQWAHRLRWRHELWRQRRKRRLR